MTTPKRFRVGDPTGAQEPVSSPRYPASAEEVAERLAAAADVLRRLPDDGPDDATAAERIERAAGRTPGWGRNAQPTARDISMAFEAKAWLAWLEAPDPKIVMRKAAGDSFQRIAEDLGMVRGHPLSMRPPTRKRGSSGQAHRISQGLSVSTVKRRYARALETIAQQLSRGGKAGSAIAVKDRGRAPSIRSRSADTAKSAVRIRSAG